MMDKEPHSLAETRKYIRQASLIYGSISILVERENDEAEEQGMVRITKKQTLEIIRQTTEKGARVICYFDGLILWIS